MRRIFFAIMMFCGIVVFNAASIAAAPTLYGPTGLITVPTAEAVKYRELQMALDTRIVDQQYEWFYKANLGSFHDMEVGFVGGQVPTEGVYLNLKYHLISDNDRYPLSVAVGLQNLGSVSRTGFYMVASKRLPSRLIAHIGFKALYDEEVIPSVMGGLEWFCTPQLSILGDFCGERRIYAVNAGMNFYLYNDFAIRMAVLDVFNSQEQLYYSIGLAYGAFL